MSLASSKGFDVSAAEGAVVVGMVVTNSTDVSGFTVVMGDLAINFIVSPRATQETLPYVVAVEGVVCCLAAPFTVLKSWFRLLISGILNGVDACSEDVLGEVPVHG